MGLDIVLAMTRGVPKGIESTEPIPDLGWARCRHGPAGEAEGFCTLRWSHCTSWGVVDSIEGRYENLHAEHHHA